MRKPYLHFLLGLGFCQSACRASVRRGWRDGQPVVVVSLDSPAELAVRLDTVRHVPIPTISFDALVQPDENHLSAITARGNTEQGVRLVRDDGPVRRGDTVAILVVSDRVDILKANDDGHWHPARHQSDSVWPGDSLGLIQTAGYRLAVGEVLENQRKDIETGDSAVLLLGNDSRNTIAGSVEWVRATQYHAEVAVHFSRQESPGGTAVFARVTVVPNKSDDSLPAVPELAIVQLPPGRAVFIPRGRRVYEVRWILSGPRVNGMEVIRTSALETPTVVVGSGIEALVKASQDSLAKHPNE
jgi:hypothetical protein